MTLNEEIEVLSELATLPGKILALSLLLFLFGLD